MSSFTTIGTALLYMSSVLMGVLSMPNVASVLAPAERGPYLTFQVARDQVPQLLPVMPRASKRGPPNNGNLPRAAQNHARSRVKAQVLPDMKERTKRVENAPNHEKP